MERETIERLAMDRTLGELDADTTALLDAYLAEHPEMQLWAEVMSQTCERTRDAISRKAQSNGIDDRAREARVHCLAAIPWWTLARWAAVILISLGIGAGVGRRFRPDAPPPPVVVARAPSTPARAGWGRIVGVSEDSFWEAKAVAILKPKVYEPSRARTAGTGLWDRYRQSRKERSYD